MKRVVREAHSKAQPQYSSGDGLGEGLQSGEDAQTIKGDTEGLQGMSADLQFSTRFRFPGSEEQLSEGTPPDLSTRTDGDFAPDSRGLYTLETTQSTLSHQGSMASEKGKSSPKRLNQGSRRLLRMPSLLKSRSSISSQMSQHTKLESPQPVVYDEEKLLLIGNAKSSGSTILKSMELAYGELRETTAREDDGMREIVVSRKSAGVRYKYRIYDVIGLHSKENKWIYSFDEMSTLIYVVDVSAYNLPASDDRPLSCIEEDLALFQQICSSKWLTTTPILLLLSSIDVLASKLRDSPLADHFPDYSGNPTDLEAAKSFFRTRFLCLNQKYGMRIWVVFTDSVATVKLGKVIVANIDKILTEEKILAFGAR